MPKSLQELKEHTLLVGSQPNWRFVVNKEVQTLPVQGRVRYNSGNALCSAALAGLGLTQLPGFYVREALARGELIEVLPEYKESKKLFGQYFLPIEMLHQRFVYWLISLPKISWMIARKINKVSLVCLNKQYSV